MNQFFCIKCDQLKPNDDATTIFTTGFVYNQGVNYAMGICGVHMDDGQVQHHSVELDYSKRIEPVEST